MSISKALPFNLFMASVKAQNRKQLFQTLSAQAQSLCGADRESLCHVLENRMDEIDFCPEDGAVVFDVKSAVIQKPVMAIISCERGIDLKAMDGVPVNIMAAILSPQSMGPMHLQRLAAVSRVLKSNDLCAAIKDARNEDALRVLFMPSQEWMLAA